jgi:hypothetical protein
MMSDMMVGVQKSFVPGSAYVKRSVFVTVYWLLQTEAEFGTSVANTGGISHICCE